MNKPTPLVVICSLLLICLVSYLYFFITWEKVEQEIGLSEKAQSQPLLAASLFLQKSGKTLKRLEESTDVFQRGKIPISPNYSLMIDEAALTEINGLESALNNWVEAGGHLIYVLSPRRNALSLDEERALDDNHLLTTSKVTVVEADTPSLRTSVIESPEANIQVESGELNLAVNMPYQHHFNDCEGKVFHTIDDELTLICEISIAEGFITFIPSIHSISNSSLLHLDHGEFLNWLVGANDGLIYMPSLSTLNWLEVLWKQSSLSILLPSLLLILYMWHVSMRIGLPENPTLATKNLFADHIKAAGNFMILNNHHQALKVALLKDLEHVMEKRIPNYKQLKIAEQAQLISKSTGTEAEEVELILSQPMPLEKEERLEYIKSFKALRKLL